MLNTSKLEQQHTSGVYAKRNLNIVRGEGAVLFDDRGRHYIDCISGQGAANLGHTHPAVREAISNQASLLVSCPEMFYNDRRGELTGRLSAWGPAGTARVFLCNSGTEAVEAAIKFARYSTGRQEVVAAMRGFHGRTLGALSATWNKKYRAPFEPLVPGFRHIPFNNLDALREQVSGQTAAVLLEIVQGEGGVHVGTPEFLQGAQEICRASGALLILDEVQTGVGRTGKNLALEHYGLDADMVCLAKSLGGGVPIGAVLLGERVAELRPGLHGSTFGGNPLACAAALATMDTMEREALPERARTMGAEFMYRLAAIDSPNIREVRGMGFMIGIELKQKVAPYIQALTDAGVLAFPAGLTVIRLYPPLVISAQQLGQVGDTVEHVLEGGMSNVA